MLNPIKRIIGDFQKPKEPIYYTSLFQSCGIGEYYLKENLGNQKNYPKGGCYGHFITLFLRILVCFRTS